MQTKPPFTAQETLLRQCDTVLEMLMIYGLNVGVTYKGFTYLL